MGLALVVSACGSSAEGMPAPTLSQSEITQRVDQADAFAQKLTAWPDIDAFVAEYTDDYAFADPTWSDYRRGAENVIAMLRQWAAVTDYHIEITGTYVSGTGAAFAQTWPGLQPPMSLPDNPPVASGLSVYVYADGKVQGEDLWYRASDDVAYGIGCFGVDGCPALQEIVDGYVAAWSSGDATAIAALYGDDATLTDEILGLEASGADAIGALAEKRFGPAPVTIEVLDVYAWTDGLSTPTDAHPERGALIGVALHYRVTLDGSADARDVLVTLELGVRNPTGFDADPAGLIHRENVYYSPDSLKG